MGKDRNPESKRMMPKRYKSLVGKVGWTGWGKEQVLIFEGFDPDCAELRNVTVEKYWQVGVKSVKETTQFCEMK